MARMSAVVVGLALLAAGCSSGNSRRQVTVFAAASLSGAFQAMAKPFASAHDNYSVTFNFAGSQQLVSQLEQGATADALATADQATMARLPAKDPGGQQFVAFLRSPSGQTVLRRFGFLPPTWA